MALDLAKGEYCVSGGYDKILRLWNPHTGKLITAYKGHGYAIDSVAVSSSISISRVPFAIC